MTIASILEDMSDAVDDAKLAIAAKGGTVGDTGLAGLATEVATIPSGGGGVSRPTTWAEFAAMTSANMQKCYGVGDRVGITCPWISPSNNTQYANLIWEIAGFGTTKKENDNTEYPCVTLVARLGTPGTYQFDAPETPTAATEETVQEGIYYFGFDGTNYTALSLNTGDTIPYGDYTAVYKTDVTNNVAHYNDIRQYGYNVYKYSAVRQWLNSDAAANAWWESQHIGDVAPNYASQAGFMKDLDSSFKAILQRTEVVTAGNGATDDGSTYKTYDYLFLPSRYELYGTSSPVEGDRMPYFQLGGSNVRGLTARGPVSAGYTGNWWERSANSGYAYKEYYVYSNGDPGSGNSASNAYMVVAACKIILAS